DEHPFTYEGEDNERGPQQWGQLNPDWQVCETGNLQSPIDLLDAKVELCSGLGNLKRAYKPAPAVIRNRGHDIMVQWTGDAGGLIINGTEYKLVQCHWHTPSEHQLHGRRFNMELHMVHNASDGTIAVVAIMYVLGRPDTFLQRVLPHLESHNEGGGGGGVVNPWEIKFGSRKYYRYMGSLTVPPCTEGVIWTVLKKVRTASREQLRALRDAVHDGFENNARPTQQWDGRSVYMYHPRL
ncbi:alpha carbonic anhydrase 4, partial [Phtheirospermum japonicum]